MAGEEKIRVGSLGSVSQLGASGLPQSTLLHTGEPSSVLRQYTVLPAAKYTLPLKTQAGVRVSTVVVLMPEAALVKLCPRSRPYIGQSWAGAIDGARSKADASRVTSTRFDGFISVPPWQENERGSGNPTARPGLPA